MFRKQQLTEDLHLSNEEAINMKIQAIAALFFSGLIAFTATADECVQTCESEYDACKAVAESATATKACEEDITSCKAECK